MQHTTKDVTFSDFMIHIAIAGCLTAIVIWSRMRALQQAGRRLLVTPHFGSRLSDQP